MRPCLFIVPVGTLASHISDIHAMIGFLVASQPGSHWLTASLAVKERPFCLPRAAPACFRMDRTMPMLNAATVAPYNAAGFRPVANILRPRRPPSFTVLILRAMFWLHRVVVLCPARVRPPGPNFTPRCLALRVTSTPIRRMDVPILLAKRWCDKAATVFALPELDHGLAPGYDHVQFVL